MAWTAPATWVSGAILTAAQLNTQLRDNLLAGGPIYTNEAARDAAITSPFEGQRAYLTAPTVPAATGATTAVPTGVTTIYNGSVWVCVTPVGAYSHTTGTTNAGYVTTLIGDGTAIAVTLVTGTTAFVSFGTEGQNTNVTQQFITFSVSGATTIAAADANGVQMLLPSAGQRGVMSRAYIFTGLTAGTNTFTLNYKVNAGTGSYFSRNLVAVGIA